MSFIPGLLRTFYSRTDIWKPLLTEGGSICTHVESLSLYGKQAAGTMPGPRGPGTMPGPRGRGRAPQRSPSATQQPHRNQEQQGPVLDRLP